MSADYQQLNSQLNQLVNYLLACIEAYQSAPAGLSLPLMKYSG
jgi:hypothetical protein